MFGRKKKKPDPPKKNSIGQNLNELVNGQLPFGWTIHYKHIMKPKDDVLIELALKTQTSDKQKRIEALQNLIQYFYSYQAECQSTPHECRHTFRSRLDSANANKRCIDLLMGHTSKDVGERVYTHKTLDELRNTINLLR